MFYRAIRGIAIALSHILYRFEISGPENIPKEGAFILCGNHISAFDPIALAAFSKRQLTFMAKKELFKFPPLGAFLRALGAFPVDRKATDMNAYRHTLKLLKDGNGFLIFSQGTRMKDFDNAKAGVAVFALKSGAPIIPVGITGPFRFRRIIQIHIGEPFSMEDYQNQKVKSELIDKIMAELAERIKPLLK
ncbi:MAG: 1-acyl-sn-glycerol-3-phosphate acyltransferase [Defluviitaleaceae bacterium]|nr:1-acyl-sn-glycerol-3-phosphate acyltransferase [Defluviitaleaceae bacterium]